MPPADAAQPEWAQDLAHALNDEFAAVHGTKLLPVDEATYRSNAARVRQSALCLSGGGIRSAAFSLGVIQALARARLLASFDYLSTVSGGGFIGSWLTALSHYEGSPAAAEQVLRDSEAAPAVRALREYTNYLTPRTGVLSADTWTGVVLYLRNVIINWFPLGTLFLLAVLAAIFYRTLLWTVSKADTAALLALAVGCCGLLIATWGSCRDVPSHRPEDQDDGVRVVEYLGTHKVELWIVVPMLVWIFVVPLSIANWLVSRDDTMLHGQALLPLVYSAAMMLGYWGAAVSGRAVNLYSQNFLGWVVATLTSALLIWIGMHLSRNVPQLEQAEILAVAGPLWLAVANVLQSTIHVALRKEAKFGDLDREWLARLSAAKLRIVVVWTLFAFCCLSLQRIAFPLETYVACPLDIHIAWPVWAVPIGTFISGPAPACLPDTHAAWPFWVVPIITFISGPTAAWLGKQAGSRLDSLIAIPGIKGKLYAFALPTLGVVFAVGLFTLLGHLAGKWLGIIQRHIPDTPISLLIEQFVIGVLLLLLILYAMRQINVNRFSMHGVYRNRLTRAFLGAARAKRQPDPFTGFDPDDNLRMSSLATAIGPRKLFPVINVALNITSSTRNAWAERKAAAFSITPLACGSPELSPPPAEGSTAPVDPIGCYVPTSLYAGQERETGRPDEPTGMTLATAMTISGAAVSPNWGYHSSPVIAFLMTLFNVRLGVWLPNPAVVKDEATLQKASPRNAFAPILGDLFGTTSDSNPAIYLSDGGHFDNLGLYEMLRRRCRFILVVDAGQDPGCNFADLGDALRKASIDQRIRIAFRERARIAARSAEGADALGFAVADIVYPDGEPGGTLLYVKPSYLPDIPADVRAYGAIHPEFPHESTLEQWFTESQFESYRALGAYQMGEIIRLMDGPGDLQAMFTAAANEQAGPDAMFQMPALSEAEE